MVLNTKAMRRAAIAATAATALVLAGCSSDNGGDDTSTGGEGTAASGEGRGPITIVEGQDPLNAALESIIADWNAEHPDEQVTSGRGQPADASELRAEFFEGLTELPAALAKLSDPRDALNLTFGAIEATRSPFWS